MAARELLAEETAADATEEERAVHFERAAGEFEDDEQFEEGLLDEEVRTDADSDLEELELDEQFVCEGCHETLDIERLADRDRLICDDCADPYGRRPSRRARSGLH